MSVLCHQRNETRLTSSDPGKSRKRRNPLDEAISLLVEPATSLATFGLVWVVSYLGFYLPYGHSNEALMTATCIKRLQAINKDPTNRLSQILS